MTSKKKNWNLLSPHLKFRGGGHVPPRPPPPPASAAYDQEVVGSIIPESGCDILFCLTFRVWKCLEKAKLFHIIRQHSPWTKLRVIATVSRNITVQIDQACMCVCLKPAFSPCGIHSAICSGDMGRWGVSDVQSQGEGESRRHHQTLLRVPVSVCNTANGDGVLQRARYIHSLREQPHHTEPPERALTEE